MNNGFMYSLSNPAFTEDIGSLQMFRMYPHNIDSLTGLANNYLPGVTLNSGQPITDSYVSPKQKREYNVIKTVIGGLILAGLAAIGIKKGTVLTRQLISKITSPFTNAWSSIKSLF